MSGRVVFALTEAQAAAMVLFASRGGHTLIEARNVPCALRAREKTFAALVARGWIARDSDVMGGRWHVTPAGHEVAALARRLANASGDLPATFAARNLCAA